MSDKDIKDLMNNLGNKVSILAEENRIYKIRDESGEKLINLLSKYISKKDWEDIYHSTNDPYIKELMLKWGSNLFSNGNLK